MKCQDCKSENKISIQKYANGVMLCDDCLVKRQKSREELRKEMADILSNEKITQFGGTITHIV